MVFSLGSPCCDEHAVTSVSQDALYGAITMVQAAVRRKLKQIWTPTFDSRNPSKEYITVIQLIKGEDEILRKVRTSDCHQCLLEQFACEPFYAEPLFVGAIISEEVMYEKLASDFLAVMAKTISKEEVDSFTRDCESIKKMLQV